MTVKAGSSSGLRVGSTVRVLDRPVTSHVRTPWYVRGRTGRVVAELGRWPNPELLAYGHADDEGVDLFRVEFDQIDLWPSYAGATGDRLMLDLYAHWLAPLDDWDARGDCS